jgi:hypothetical protein
MKGRNVSMWQRLFGKATEQHSPQTPGKLTERPSRPPQNQPASVSAGQATETLPASIARVIDTSSPLYQEILREVAPVIIRRLAADSSTAPVELARKLITDAVLSRTEVGPGQDPMEIAHTVLMHEDGEIEKHAMRFAEAYKEVALHRAPHQDASIVSVSDGDTGESPGRASFVFHPAGSGGRLVLRVNNVTYEINANAGWEKLTPFHLMLGIEAQMTAKYGIVTPPELVTLLWKWQEDRIRQGTES